MIPRTEQGAYEKLYRVKQYLLTTSGYAHDLTLDQLIGMSQAISLLGKVRMLFW